MAKLEPVKKELYDIIALADYIEDTYQVKMDQREIWFWFVDKYEISNGSIVELDLNPRQGDKPVIALFKEYVMKDYGPSISILAQW